MIVDFNNSSLEIIYSVLSYSFKNVDILREQATNSTINVEYGYDYRFLHFNVKKNHVKKFPISVTVPIIMIYFRKEKNPVSFLLHLKNGYISILEIMTDDSSFLDLHKEEVVDVKYEINPILY